MKYKLKYWFEHGGGCLWSANERTTEKYGYLVAIEKLPFSNEIIDKLYQLEKEYGTYLNWDDPTSPSLWTEEHKSDFLCRAREIYYDLSKELNGDYEVINEVESCVN